VEDCYLKDMEMLVLGDRTIYYGLCPTICIGAILTLVTQFKSKKETFKNYRYFLHITLLCLLIAYVSRVADMIRVTPSENLTLTP
jgi:hypothetical protein